MHVYMYNYDDTCNIEYPVMLLTFAAAVARIYLMKSCALSEVERVGLVGIARLC